MKKVTRTTTTVTLDEAGVRVALAEAASEGIGRGNPADVLFQIGPPVDLDGYEIGSEDIVRSASIVIPVSNDQDGNVQVVCETTVEMEVEDMLGAIARHVATSHDLTPLASNVTLSVSDRRAKVSATVTVSCTKRG